MPGRAASARFRLEPEDRAALERWARRRTAQHRTVLRCRMVLLLGDGLSAREVARRLGVSRHTVDLWRTRYLEEGRETVLRDKPGRGRRSVNPSADCAIACEHISGAEISRLAERLPRPTVLRKPDGQTK